MDGLTFLERVEKSRLRPVYVVYGDEAFLKRHVLDALRIKILDQGDDEFGYSSFAGDKTTFAEVRNEVTTLPFLGGRRMVVVEGADPFVTKERSKLEKYVEEPSKTGVLVLEPKSWTSTTNLAKKLGEAAINCKAAPSRVLPEWCVKWCESEYQTKLPLSAARLLVDLVGTDMGQLNQELNKLSLYIGDRKQIAAQDVDRLVGNSREQKTWEIFDLIGAGRTAEALAFLDRLFAQGEEPIRLLGAFSMQLRRLAQAGRLAMQGTSLPAAMEAAKIPSFARKKAELQLRHLGRRRINQLFNWLLEVDLGVKGSSELPPRTQLERLVINLARKSEPMARS